MTDAMTVGPAIVVGGNQVQLNNKGKIQITNPQGKIKVLTKDQFEKQLLKNIDKLETGEDFEFKSDSKAKKALTISGVAVGAVTLVTGIVYRKEIGKYMKNFTWKKFWNDIKGLFSGKKNLNPFENVLQSQGVTKEQYAAMKKLAAKQNLTDAEKTLLREAHLYDTNTAERYTNAIEIQTKKALLNDAALKQGVTEEQYAVMKKLAAKQNLTDAEKTLLREAHLYDTNTAERYTNVIDIGISKQFEEFLK